MYASSNPHEYKVCATAYGLGYSENFGIDNGYKLGIPGQATVYGNNYVNPGDIVTYTANATNTDVFYWTAPVDWNPNSGNGTSFTSIVGNSTGQVCATPYNICGYGQEGCLYVNVSVGIEEELSDKYLLYPNPSHDKVYISNAEDVQSVEIYNMRGEKLKSLEFNKFIDISGFPKGIYFIQIKLKDGLILPTQRIIKI